MPQYSVTFTKALEISDASKSQQGLLVAENVDLERRGVLRKRPGAEVISRVRSADPEDQIPVEELRAVWHRNNEIVLEGYDQIYSYQSCARGAPGGQDAGTATPAEISDAQAVLADVAAQPRVIDVILPGDATAGAARNRANRPDFPVVLTITPPGRSIVITVDETSPNKLAWTAVELLTTNGPNALTGVVQRLPRMQDISLYSIREEVLLTWIADGVLSTLTMTPDVGDATFTTVAGTLDTLRGPASLSRYESRENTVVYFAVDGVLHARRAENPIVDRAFAVSNPPNAGTRYAIDHTSTLFPVVNMAAVWISDEDNILHAADLVPLTEVVDDEHQTANIRAFFDRNVGIEVGAQRSVAIGSSGLNLSAVWHYVAGTPLVVVDLAGALLRLTIETTGVLRYDLRNAATLELLSVSAADVGVGSPVDQQWLQRGDTVYGVTLLGSTLSEVRWRRSFDLVPVPFDLPTAVSRFGLSQSGARFALAYWRTGQSLRLRLINDIDDFSAKVVDFFAPVTYQPGGPIATAVLTEIFADDADVRVHSWIAPGSVHSVTARSSSSSLADPRIDPWGETPTFVAATAAGSSPRTMLAVQYPSLSIEVWEVSLSVFVRVSPGVVVVAGGDWQARGRWTRTKARSGIVQDHGNSRVISVDAATVFNDLLEPCTIVVSEVGGSGALANVVSTHTESDVVIDATGKRPRASSLDVNRAQVTYEAVTLELFTAIWERFALSFGALGITLTADRVWDQTALEVPATSIVAWAAVAVPLAIQLDIRPTTGVPASVSRPTDIVVPVDCGIHLEPVPGSDTNVWVTWAIAGEGGGGPELRASIELYNSATGTLAPVFVRVVNLADNPFAVACATRDGLLAEVWLEVALGPNRRVQLWDLTAGGGVLVATQKRAALASQLATLNGATVGAFSLLGTTVSDTDSPDPTTFVGGEAYRSGVLLKNARSGEVVGRLGVGAVETFDERTMRSAKASLDMDAFGALDLGWQELQLAIEAERASIAVRYRWDPNVGAHEPAVIDSVVVGAHGGYPRQYAGRVVHEHDWHELVEVVSVVVGAGGALSDGTYLVALTWRAIDETGKLARSRPTFIDEVTVTAGQRIDIRYRGLTQTERPFTACQFWRSVAGGQELFLDAENLAILNLGNDSQLQQLTRSDSDLRGRDVLDQGDAPGEIIPSDPIAITDFTAVANGRIWSRDVRESKTSRFSTLPRPGFSAHWSLAFIAHHQGAGDLTAVAEMDARVIMLSALTASATYGDGPDNTGAGTYAVPARIPTEIGAADHATLALIPEGLVFSPGPGLPVQLLTRGFTSAPIAARIDSTFHRDGMNVVSTSYERRTDTLHLLDGNAPDGLTNTLRFHFGSQRWASDTGRQGLDLTIPDDGQLVILTTDGRVLFEDSTRYDSGGAGYHSRMRTPWLQAQGGRLTSLGDVQTIHVIGRWEGEHALRLSIYYDYSDEASEVAEIPSGALTQHAADGDLYAYEYNPHGRAAYAVSIEIADTGEPNETWSLERIVVQTETGKFGPSPAGLPPGHTFDRTAT